MINLNSVNSIEAVFAYLSDSQLAQRYNVSRATIWRWSSEGRIPKPVKLTPGCTRWRLADISKWELEAIK